VVLERRTGELIGLESGRGRTDALGRRARAGRYDSTRSALEPARVDDPQREDARGVPSRPTPSPRIPGRSLVTRRAIVDIVRAATLGSYGVTGFARGTWLDRIGELVGLPPRGIAIGLGGSLTIDLDLTVGRGLPVAEVARQVESAVRYAIRRSLGVDVDRLTIHIDGLRANPLSTVPGDPASGAPASAATVRPDELAASGTDVA